MRNVAVIPVRMGSERLPGKVMREVEGRPLLGHLLDRVKLSSELSDVIVATSDFEENDCIQSFCNQQGVRVFRGSETDVLDRILGALRSMEADNGVLVFGDGPLIDPQIIDDVTRYFLEHSQYDFVSNDLETSWPPGMEVEAFNVAALADSAVNCTDLEIREHSTLYIRQHPDRYRLKNLSAEGPLNRPDVSFEVDVEEDMIVVESLLKIFRDKPKTPLPILLDYMDSQPDLKAISSSVARKWKRYRS